MKHKFYQLKAKNPASMREARLCFQHTPESSSTVDSVSRWASSGAEWLASNTAWVTAELGVAAGRLILSVPKGILEGFKVAWDAHAPNLTKDDALKFLYNAAQFCKDYPLIGDLATTYINKVNAAERFDVMNKLVDQLNWIPLFQDDDLRNQILNEDRINDKTPNDRTDGQKEVIKFLQGTAKVDRQKFFMNLVDASITQSAQRNVLGQLPPNYSPNERFDAMETDGKTKDFANALSAIFGMSGAPADGTDAFRLAKESLQELYRPGLKVRDDDFQKLSDFQAASAPGNSLNRTPDGLLQNAPASRMKGAILAGVIGQKEINELDQSLQQKVHTKNLVTATASNLKEKLTGAVSASVEKEGRSFVDTWNNMSGVEKLVLVGALAFLLKTSKWARNIGIGVVGVYFFRKFVMKDDDPAKSMSNNVMSVYNMGVNKGRSAMGYGEGPMNGQTSDNLARAKVIMDFLPYNERCAMELQTTGLALLSQTPITLVADAFETGPGGARPWKLNMTRGLDTHLQQVMDKNGWKSDYKEFFKTCMPMIAEGVGYTLYKLAARNPQNSSDKRIVDKAIDRLKVRETPTDFCKHISDPEPDGETFRQGDAAFIRMVSAGRAEGTSVPRGTVGEFIMSERAKEAPRPNNSLEQQSASKIAKMNQIHKDILVDSPGFKLELKSGNIVHYGLNLTDGQRAETPLDQFTSVDAKTIFEKYDAWRRGSDRTNRNPLQ